MPTERFVVQSPETLAVYVRALRRRRGWTQADVARQLDMSVARVSAIERAPGRVQTAQLLALLRVLGARLAIEIPSTDMVVAESREDW